jgi:hypothetical protein
LLTLTRQPSEEVETISGVRLVRQEDGSAAVEYRIKWKDSSTDSW